MGRKEEKKRDLGGLGMTMSFDSNWGKGVQNRCMNTEFGGFMYL